MVVANVRSLVSRLLGSWAEAQVEDAGTVDVRADQTDPGVAVDALVGPTHNAATPACNHVRLGLGDD